MGKKYPSSLKPREVKKILRQLGGYPDRHAGDHEQWKVPVGDRWYTVTVDNADELDLFILKSIARQAQIDMNTFWQLYFNPGMQLNRSSVKLPADTKASSVDG